jgi:small nuclear ribonucleoprotein (snRNP)-like protein
LINQGEINNLKENNKNYKNENNKLWDEINKLKQYHIDSKIIESKDNINFILDYIKQNDKTFNFNNIKLLFRGSRDGDRTKTCHELCDNKQNVLIIMKSEDDYIFGGYSKIGFKINDNLDYKIDNNCFLFSLNLKKIYPVIKDKEVICNLEEIRGLCFYGSLAFVDNFMNIYDNQFMSKIKLYFNGLNEDFEMNGGNKHFRCKDLEVFQLI